MEFVESYREPFERIAIVARFQTGGGDKASDRQDSCLAKISFNIGQIDATAIIGDNRRAVVDHHGDAATVIARSTEDATT